MNAFTIDGKAFNISVITLKRKSTVIDGEKAGRTQDARMHRDIKGTFYNYSMTIDTSWLNTAQYDALYEVLTAPVSSHDCVFPYGQHTIIFDAYVTNADDELLIMGKDSNLWGNLNVNFIAMSPARLPS